MNRQIEKRSKATLTSRIPSDDPQSYPKVAMTRSKFPYVVYFSSSRIRPQKRWANSVAVCCQIFLGVYLCSAEGGICGSA